MTRAVAIVSGGMDSVVLAHMLKHEGHDLDLVSFDYGQRHSKELDFAEQCARDLDAAWHLVDLSAMNDLLEKIEDTLSIVASNGRVAKGDLDNLIRKK